MNAQETLPSELRLSAPPSMPQARSYMFKQKSEYTEYDVTKNNKIRINIPRLQRTYLSKDSYIRFRLNVQVKYTASGSLKAGPVYIDRAGAYTLFDRLEVYDYMGGTLLENVSNIPELMIILNDIGASSDALSTKLEQNYGNEGSLIGMGDVDGNQYEIRTSNSGQKIFTGNWNNSVTAVGFNTIEFAIPVPSFLGLFSDKFVPLHNGFTLDLYLNSKENVFISYGMDQTSNDNPLDPADITSATTITDAWISGMEFCAQLMELGNEAENLVLASNGSEPLVIPSTFYRYFQSLIKGKGETDQSSTAWMDLNLNVVSLKNVRFGFRPLVYTNTTLAPSYGHRIRNFLSRFNFQYGSSYLPELAGITCRSTTLPISRNGATPINGTHASKRYGNTQAFNELLKTHTKSYLTTLQDSPSITKTQYAIDIAFSSGFEDFNGISPSTIVPPIGKYVTQTTGKFLGGIDLRLSPKQIVSGIDTNGLLVRLNAYFDDSNLDNMVNAIWDVFCEHDAFIQVIPGVATTATF